MKTSITFLVFTLFSFTSLIAQEETVFGSGSVKLSGVWGGSNNALVKLSDNYDLSEGGYFLFEFNNDYLIGWSGYGSTVTLETDDKVKLSGHDLLIGYTFQSEKSIHPVAYLKGGVADLEVNEIIDDNVGVIEPSVGIEANITRWFRLGIEGGYRFVTGVDVEGLTDSDFSSPLLGLRLKFGWSWR